MLFFLDFIKYDLVKSPDSIVTKNDSVTEQHKSISGYQFSAINPYTSKSHI